MTTTKLSSKGYGILKDAITESDYKIVKDKLTVKPNTVPGYGKEDGDLEFQCFRENSTHMYLPKFYGIKTFGSPQVNDLEPGTSINVDFSGSLRPVQEEAVATFLNPTSLPRGGLLVLPCGFGKTVCALYIVHRIAKKTLIIVHQSTLLKQWKDRIEQYLPNARVGVIQAKKCDVQNKDIVIAMLQSLSVKDYSQDTFKDFGLVIVDEVHHIAARVFSQALYKVNFMYSLGLSATPVRQDGLTKVIKWFLGDVIFKVKRKNDVVQVSEHIFVSEDSRYNTVEMLYNHKPNISKMINNLCEFMPRTEYIVKLLKDLKEREPNRNVIILSDRKEKHLYVMEPLIKAALPNAKVGYYVGGMKENDLRRSETECDVLLATFKMAQEAMDIPKLDTLILASPKSNIEQAIGRIQRKRPEDRVYDPLVIDIADKFSAFSGMYRKRHNYFMKMEYEVETNTFDMDSLSRALDEEN